MNIEYILSQVIQFFAYGLLVFITLRKTKKEMMWLLVVFNVLMVASFALLENSETGIAVSALMALKCLVEYLVSKEKLGKNITIVVDIIIWLGILISSIYAYNGFGSLLSIFGTVLFLLSAMMKSVLNLKIFIFLSTICWLLYNLYVGAYVGVALECVIIVSGIIGILAEFRYKKQTKQA